MLPSANRMRSSADFRTVTRSRYRARRGVLVVSLRPLLRTPESPTLVGLIVGKSVGGSVVRHAVSRRLRAQLALRLCRLPAGSAVVVRALPESARSSSATLGRDLDEAFDRLLEPGRS